MTFIYHYNDFFKCFFIMRLEIQNQVSKIQNIKYCSLYLSTLHIILNMSLQTMVSYKFVIMEDV